MGPIGFTHKKQPGYKRVGIWGWNDERLWSKIEVNLDIEHCWPWQGAMSPSGALMGAWKDDSQQMTQARRLVYMSHTNEDVTPYSVTMKCNNQACCNPNHFELKRNNRAIDWNVFGEENDY
jgi:hypothetical protein